MPNDLQKNSNNAVHEQAHVSKQALGNDIEQRWKHFWNTFHASTLI
jgi:hypothetical protein